MLGWTVKDPSTYHFRMPDPSALNVKARSLVSRRYFMRWTILPQSCLSGSRTLVVRYEIAVPVSGRARFVAKRTFATRLWNASALSLGSFAQSSSTTNRSFGAALALVPVSLGAAFSKALRTSST